MEFRMRGFSTTVKQWQTEGKSMLHSLLMTVSLASAMPASGEAPTMRPIPPVTSAADAAEERVAIPFNPPLVSRPRKATTRSGQEMSVWMDYRYTFSRDGDGFLMLVEPIDFGVDVPRLPTAEARQAFRRMLDRALLPFTVRLSADAIIDHLIDAEAVWERVVDRSMELVAQTERESDSEALAFARQTMLDLPTVSRLTLLMQQTSPILELAATDFSREQPDAVAFTFDAPFGGTIEQQATVTITDVRADTVFYEIAASVPGEQMLAQISNFIERVPLNGRGQNTPEGRAQALREFRDAEMRMEAESRYEVDRTTGLSRRYTVEQRVSIRSGSNNVVQRQTLSGERRN